LQFWLCGGSFGHGGLRELFGGFSEAFVDLVDGVEVGFFLPLLLGQLGEGHGSNEY